MLTKKFKYISILITVSLFKNKSPMKNGVVFNSQNNDVYPLLMALTRPEEKPSWYRLTDDWWCTTRAHFILCYV